MFDKEFITNNYISLTEKLNDISNSGNEGAFIVLEINPRDYLLSQIIHLVEQNNANVIHVFSYMEEETSKQIVILKIDLEDASPVLRSFERFNYTVRYYIQKQMLSDETMRNRLDELMYYIEM
jgi:alpha-D-ribose 1-methylphosphonate 5-triphosphate diphosphatase PhnM